MESTHHNIALLPPPALLGHLIAFIELAKKLVLRHHCPVTLIIPHDGSPMNLQRSLLQGIPAAITPIFLPPVSTDDLPDYTDPEVLLPIRITRSLPALRDTLSETTPAALVVDLFAPDAIDVARELGIPAYIFYSSAATELSFSLDLPGLHASCILPEPLILPGSVVLNRDDLPDSIKDKETEVYKLMVDLCKKYLSSHGILVNSFEEMESEALKYLQLRRPEIPPVYPVGPLIRTGLEPESDRESDCLKWLNDQPPKSVLFVSFGSGGALSVEQIRELASGLEMSGQRFLWVVRSPHETAAAAYFKAGDKKKTLWNICQKGSRRGPEAGA